LLEGYIGYFLSSDSSFDTVVLVLESFGAGVVERYVSTAQLERALERAARFDPAVWVYLPLLWNLGLEGARRLVEELDRRAGLYMDKAVEAVKRSVAERRRARLAAPALASKHLIGAQEVQGYQGYLGLCTSILGAAIGAAEKAYSDLDVIERALLLIPIRGGQQDQRGACTAQARPLCRRDPQRPQPPGAGRPRPPGRGSRPIQAGRAGRG